MSKSVLIVDDDQLLQPLLKDEFEKAGFSVSTAGNGEEGLILALSYRYDLILSDLLMPKMDGSTMINRIRSDQKMQTVPIILLTSYSMNDNSIQSLVQDKNTYYAMKTDTPIKELIQKVKEILDKPGDLNA